MWVWLYGKWLGEPGDIRVAVTVRTFKSKHVSLQSVTNLWELHTWTTGSKQLKSFKDSFRYFLDSQLINRMDFWPGSKDVLPAVHSYMLYETRPAGYAAALLPLPLLWCSMDNKHIKTEPYPV